MSDQNPHEKNDPQEEQHENPQQETAGEHRNGQESQDSEESQQGGQPQDQDADPGHTAPCPGLVVALGTSAGGLEALSELLDNLPLERNLCLVVVQHRGDHQKRDMLVELLGQHSQMQVITAEDNSPLKPGLVHVIPPDTIACIKGGRFELRKKEPREMVIDHFFTSLAREAGRHAVAVVLSGSNTDGTLGAREVRAADGLVLAQQPETAAYDTMPRSVIHEGLADEVLPPSEVPSRIQQYASHLDNTAEREAATSGRFPYPPELRKKLLSLLERHTGQDFSQYKTNTVNRRIRRRMDVHHLDDLHDYLRLVRGEEDEARALFRELLIGVTHFFRDTNAWNSLRDVLVNSYLPRRGGEEFRVWLPGCATGEEAYTLAMILREALQKLEMDASVSIYASDLDVRAIDKARGGLYPLNIAQDISPERLERHFTQTENGYKVRRELRETVIFATHNLLRDPPFSNLDLICCRNLLMYLVPLAQRKVLARFQYGLKPGGLLFLGTAESVSTLEEPFKALDPKWRVFSLDPEARQTEIPRSERPSFKTSSQRQVPQLPQPRTPRKRGRSSLQRISERFLLEQVCPPSVLATRSGDILYIHGRTGAYLELSPGEAGTNLLSMAREGLRAALADSLGAMVESREHRVRRGLQVKSNDHYENVDLHLYPVEDKELDQSCYMVSFFQAPGPEQKTSAANGEDDAASASRIRELEHELRHTRQNLRAVIEDYEAANEELESSNEELQSTNEELKSTNEELETSREELESINEEQSTLNDELQAKNQELASINDDMANLLAATRVATLFLDSQLKIRRFTPAMQEFMGVRDQDLGRPVQDISLRLNYEHLAEDAATVLKRLDSLNREVQGDSDSWFQLRIAPYRTTENVIDGVVLTLNDISELKRNQRQAEEAQLFAENLVDTIDRPLIVLDETFTVHSANPAFYRFFETSRQDTVGRSLFDLGDGQWDIPELRTLLQEIIPEQTEVQDYIVEHTFPRIGSRRMRLNARRIATEVLPPRILLVMNENSSQAQSP